MSAILERPAKTDHVIERTFPPLSNPLPPDLEPESIFSEAPRLPFDPAAELERLRPLLVDYDPRDEPVKYYHPPRSYGVVIAKFIGYSFLGFITIGLGMSILSAFTLGC